MDKKPQDDICILCEGDGRDPVQDFGLTKVCRCCGGNGKRKVAVNENQKK